MLMEKSAVKDLNYELLLPECVEAPVTQGEPLGELVVRSGDKELARVLLTAETPVERLSVPQIYGRMLSRLFGG